MSPSETKVLCKLHFSSIHLRRNKRYLRSCLRSSVMNHAKCKKANVSNFSTAKTEYTWEGHYCQLHLSLKMILKEAPKQTVPTHKSSTFNWVGHDSIEKLNPKSLIQQLCILKVPLDLWCERNSRRTLAIALTDHKLHWEGTSLLHHAHKKTKEKREGFHKPKNQWGKSKCLRVLSLQTIWTSL